MHAGNVVPLEYPRYGSTAEQRGKLSGSKLHLAALNRYCLAQQAEQAQQAQQQHVNADDMGDDELLSFEDTFNYEDEDGANEDDDMLPVYDVHIVPEASEDAQQQPQQAQQQQAALPGSDNANGFESASSSSSSSSGSESSSSKSESDSSTTESDSNTDSNDADSDSDAAAARVLMGMAASLQDYGHEQDSHVMPDDAAAPEGKCLHSCIHSCIHPYIHPCIHP